MASTLLLPSAAPRPELEAQVQHAVLAEQERDARQAFSHRCARPQAALSALAARGWHC